MDVVRNYPIFGPTSARIRIIRRVRSLPSEDFLRQWPRVIIRGSKASIDVAELGWLLRVICRRRVDILQIGLDREGLMHTSFHQTTSTPTG